MTSRRHERYELAASTVIMLLGLAIFLRPLVQYGGGRAPGDYGDGRFIHYLLEHSWRWISGNPRHPLWDPPYYFPIEGAGAYSDLMAGAGPLYWPWRLTGMAPGDAYQAWLVAVAVLNITAAFLVLQRCLRFSPLAAAIGATFLSAAAPLQNESNHPQMLPQFYVMGVLAGLVMLVQSVREPFTLRRRAAWVALAATCFVLQMYTAFYYAWFMMLAGGIALAWALVLPPTRPAILRGLRLSWQPLLAGAALAGVALVPWALHYVDAASLNDPITYEQMSGWIPRWESWLYLGPNSPLYQWALDWSQFAAIPDGTNHEHRLGVGLLTLVLIGLGYLAHWRNPWAWISALVAITLVAMTTIIPGGITAWRLFFEILPGATAVRTMTRVALVVLIPMAIGIALLVERLRSGRYGMAVPLLAAVILAEQVIDYPTYDIDGGLARSEAIAGSVPGECTSFLYSPTVHPDEAEALPRSLLHLDAMWAGLMSDTPTLNAYGHIVPSGWPFAELAIATADDEARLAGSIVEWETQYPEAAPTCHVIIEYAPYWAVFSV